MLRYVALLALIFVPMQLHAQGDSSGNRLQHDCRIALTSQDKGVILEPDEWLSVGYCYGRIEGVINTSLLWHNYNGVSGRTSNGEACAPADVVTTREATKVVMKYLDGHPEKLHVLATALILYALREAYPCKD